MTDGHTFVFYASYNADGEIQCTGNACTDSMQHIVANLPAGFDIDLHDGSVTLDDSYRDIDAEQFLPRPAFSAVIDGNVIENLPSGTVIKSYNQSHPVTASTIIINAPIGSHHITLTGWPYKIHAHTLMIDAEIPETELTSANADIITLNPYPDLPQCINACKSRVDAAAGAARSRYITTDPGQAETYAEKLRDAEAFIASQTADWDNLTTEEKTAAMEAHPWVTAAATARNITMNAAANIITATAAQWRAKGVEIEQARETAKQQIDQSADQISAINITHHAEQTMSSI